MTSADTPHDSGLAVAGSVEFLTAPEVATVLRLDGPWQVAKLCRDGKLVGTKPGQQWLIRPSDLQAYIDAGWNVQVSA
jgi:excisionase family DNA binding protein